MRGKKLFPVLVCIAALVVVLSLATGCGEKKEVASEKPKVIAVAPETGPIGAQFEIIGERFGTTQEEGVVHVGIKIAEVASWSDTRITAEVPSGLEAMTYPVTVLTTEGESNYVEFTVTGQQGKPQQQPQRKEGQVEHVTAEQAMIEYMKQHGKDLTGMTFSIVQISEKDPNWKIDVAKQPGKSNVYFLLHNENGNWVIKDTGNALSGKELAAKGAPSDLYSRPQSTTQAEAVFSYVRKQGGDPTGLSVVVTRVSGIDPSWELGLARKAGQPDQTVVFHKEGRNWMVKGMGANLTSQQIQALGAPSDLFHTATEAQTIVAWIQAGNAPPGVTSTGWSLKVLKVSRIDPNWEIVRGIQQGEQGTMYFLLHWDGNKWSVMDSGGSLTRAELNAPGSPSDLP